MKSRDGHVLLLRESHFDSKDENVTLAVDDRYIRPPRCAGRPATPPADIKVSRAMLFIGTATYIYDRSDLDASVEPSTYMIDEVKSVRPRLAIGTQNFIPVELQLQLLLRYLIENQTSTSLEFQVLVTVKHHVSG